MSLSSVFQPLALSTVNAHGSLEVGMSKVTPGRVNRNLSEKLQFGFEFEIRNGRPARRHGA